MKSQIVATLLLMLSMTIVVYFLVTSLGDLALKEDELRKHVGEEVIIQGDTLVITSYSLLNNEYTLSNGIVISAYFLKQ